MRRLLRARVHGLHDQVAAGSRQFADGAKWRADVFIEQGEVSEGGDVRIAFNVRNDS